jgi:hypothetical protein
MNQINYPWHLAPDWAEYAAIDQSGSAFWFEGKPFILIDIFEPEERLVWESGNYARIVDWAIPNFHWKLSLQKRPNT